MAQTRERNKGRTNGPSFVQLPHYVLNHPNFLELSGHSVKLLLDMCAQYKGANNGDLAMPWSRMEKRGWKSRDTLNRARRELLDRLWLVITRQGGRKKPTLYAVTLWPIDGCQGKLDVVPTTRPTHSWKQGHKKSFNTISVSNNPKQHEYRANE